MTLRMKHYKFHLARDEFKWLLFKLGNAYSLRNLLPGNRKLICIIPIIINQTLRSYRIITAPRFISTIHNRNALLKHIELPARQNTTTLFILSAPGASHMDITVRGIYSMEYAHDVLFSFLRVVFQGPFFVVREIMAVMWLLVVILIEQS